jgi:hypothetical protein
MVWLNVIYGKENNTDNALGRIFTQFYQPNFHGKQAEGN